MASAFGNAIAFLADIGLYEVILPFILVFTIVFAILEKTRVFGMEDIEGKKYTRKNLNAMVAFVMAFLVVGSSQLVEAINLVSSQVVILLMLSVLFLLLIGSFMKEGEGVFLRGGWKTIFTWIMFIGIVLIFLNAVGWLGDVWYFIEGNSGGETVGAIVLLVLVVFFVYFVVYSPKGHGMKHDDDHDDHGSDHGSGHGGHGH